MLFAANSLVLEPIPTTGLTSDDVTALTERVREAMLQEIGPLTAQGRAWALTAATKGSKSAPVAVPAASTSTSADKATSSGVSL